MIVLHFIDVGQGNMTLVEMPDGRNFLYDCNVTDENEQRVLAYLRGVLSGRSIAFFVNSHRDADHMRGLKRIVREFPIGSICDNETPCGTPECVEYKEYMEVRRAAREQFVVKWDQAWPFGPTARARVLNSANELLRDDGNAQSIILRIEHVNPANGVVLNSVILAGDSDADAWNQWVVPVYQAYLPSTILLASHHGADTFFKLADGTWYTAHLAAIRPRMTVISVGDNTYGHPDAAALRAYTAGSLGDELAGGMKIARTDQHGSIKLVLQDDGGWKMTWLGPSPKPAPKRTLLTGRTLATRRTVLRDLMIDPSSRPSRLPSPGRTFLTDLLKIPSAPRPPSEIRSLLDILKIPQKPKKTALEELLERIKRQPPPK